MVYPNNLSISLQSQKHSHTRTDKSYGGNLTHNIRNIKIFIALYTY